MHLVNRVVHWLEVEPAISLLMVVAAVALFASALRRRRKAENHFWPWLRTIIEASVSAVLFVGLLWAFRAVLNENRVAFHRTHGSLSDASLQSAQTIWGGPIAQRELSVSHFVTRTVEEEIPRENPDDPPRYRTRVERVYVPQNSIVGFTGDIDLQLSEREKGYALYNGYIAEAELVYDVVNDSAQRTEAEFTFPLSSGQTLIEDFRITVDGADVSRWLRFSADAVRWSRWMAPYEHAEVAISYRSRGMETFYYQIPTHREIRDFVLTVEIDRLPVSEINYPEGVLTATSFEPTADGRGSRLVWRFDRVVTVAGMGIALPQPEQPGADVLRVLLNSAYAITMLGCMVALTLLIRGEGVHFLELALLSAVYCVQFLVMAAVSDYALGFWGSWVLGAVLTGGLAFLLYRHLESRATRLLIYGLTTFFTLGYPLAGLLTEIRHRNAFDGLVQAGLIVYLFVLALVDRLSRQERDGHVGGSGLTQEGSLS